MKKNNKHISTPRVRLHRKRRHLKEEFQHLLFELNADQLIKLESLLEEFQGGEAKGS